MMYRLSETRSSYSLGSRQVSYVYKTFPLHEWAHVWKRSQCTQALQ